jgi:hypothetical protein
MPSTEEIHAYIELALAFHEGSHFGPPPSLADIARDYLTRTARALRVVRALEAGIPAPRSIRGAWVYAGWGFDGTPDLTRQQAAALGDWLFGLPKGTTFPSFTDAVLAAAEAAGLEER